MSALTKEIEVERVINLVRGFGWEKTEEIERGTDLLITIKKKIHTEAELEGAGANPLA